MKRGVALCAASVLLLGLFAAPAQATPENFRTHLTGANELPAVASEGQGQAVIQVDSDGAALRYRLIVAHIDEVTQAHIHCGGVDVNGPIVAFLFGFVGEGVTQNGVLASGTVTGADIIPRPDSAVCPGGVADFGDLLAKLRSGGAYVNVHTIDHPAGEIRGQL